MTAPRVGDAEFVALFEKHGAAGTADQIGVGVRNVFARRANLEKKLGRQITGPDDPRSTRHHVEHPGRLELDVDTGIVLVASDCHYWPGIISTAHRAFVRACKELKPVAVVMNGDVLDGAGISRHPPIGWEDRPSLLQEIEACKDRLGEITIAAEKARRFWTLGNHDSRFETRLATVAPEYAKIHGVHLKDHFPDYEPCWSVWINGDVVIKHRFKNGIHATHNNVMWAGKSMVTGHLHSLKTTPLTNYAGTKWGVDTGTLADPFAPSFNDYLEDNPRNWRSGFAVLTFERGELRWPELVHVIEEGRVEFRGRSYSV